MNGPIWKEVQHSPYNEWQVGLFIRSGCIIGALICLEVALWAYPGILSWVFRSLKIRMKTITAHGVIISSEEQPTVPGSPSMAQSSYCWVLRCALLSITLYLWDRLITQADKFSGDAIRDWNMVYESCLTGGQCYALPTESEQQLQGLLTPAFLRALFIWDLQPVCNYFVQEGSLDEFSKWQRRAKRQRKVICFSTTHQSSWTMIFDRIAVSVVIAFTWIFVFEGLTSALVQYTHRKFLNLRVVVWIFIGLVLVAWIYVTTNAALHGIGDTAEYFILLAIVVVFFHAQRLASLLKVNKQYQEAKNIEMLSKTELGAQLDEMLAKASSDLEDSTGARKRSKRQRAQQLLTKLRQRIKHHSSDDEDLDQSPADSVTNETFVERRSTPVEQTPRPSGGPEF